MMSRILAAATALALVVPTVAAACPFCNSAGTTLTGEAAQASMILFGTLSNPQLLPGADYGQGTTDLSIELVVKDNPFLAGRKTITLPRYVPVAKDDPVKYLVFCDVYQGKIDPYRGIQVKADSPIAKYLKGALAVKDKDLTARLQFFFQYLQDPDIEVANDAFMEFGNVDYKDFRPVAEKLPAEAVAKWLVDPNTPATRFGLYGSILGHSPDKKYAGQLRALLDDQQRRFSSGLDGVLAGYVMLDPKGGMDYVRAILKKADEQMLIRYAALRNGLRFFYEFRPDVIGQKDVLDALEPLLDQGDIADLAIEDLRKWGRWDKADRVLALFGLPSHDVPVIKRSILRFALSCPPDKSPKAAEFVVAQRKRDAEWVADAEELLRLETTPPVKPATSPAKSGRTPPSP